MSGFGKGLPEPVDLQEQINKQFEPRPFQKEMFDRMKDEKIVPPLRWGRPRYIGVDLATAHGDKSVIMDVRKSKNNQISVVYMDEWGSFPDYKWYRNPIKWWKWRRMWKFIDKQRKERGDEWMSSIPF